MEDLLRNEMDCQDFSIKVRVFGVLRIYFGSLMHMMVYLNGYLKDDNLFIVNFLTGSG